ncbi:hypothetical protein [Sorangium sp. So ce406]|uniref:hypothetical protein n=1 Tax=Sorangium sp. So ce406 TaxID=3133311 RepID=UPI003F5CAFAB
MKPPFALRRVAAGLLFAAVSAAVLAGTAPALAGSSYTLFESGQVRPLALSPSGNLLFALNTPDGRLEVFRVRDGALVHRGSIPVGLEPVAVAARSETEVWVVNHLSDSVSVVRVSAGGAGGHVERTLLVGDEPRDIVFAGPGRRRAFITAAHRGQNNPNDPQLTTPGVGRADVWVFDANHLGATLGGAPLTILTLFTDTPRALAATPDGTRVYAAGFHSGNQTTVVTELLVPDGGEANGGSPGPTTNADGDPAPEVSLIVKFDGAHWVDELGRWWDSQVKLSLPDKDVFAIDAMATPPKPVAGPSGHFAGVGTILFNMVVNPVNGKVYVSNTDARNERRFEGPGIFAGQSVRGHLHESRVTVLGAGNAAPRVAPRHLNKHIDYATCCAPTPNAESEASLAQPVDMAVTSDGATLYVAALGSSKVGVFSTAALEDDTFVPDAADHIEVSGGGPSGLALDEARGQLFVLTRFDNAISIIDTATGVEAAHVPMYNPEPPSVTAGRSFLYDARSSSAHGDSSCASCHIFGDFDSLGWDLGNPDAQVLNNPGPFVGPLLNLFTQQPMAQEFHPMKGPTTTQSLRGMANHGPMHWRGDRTGGNDAPNAQPDSGSLDERAGFMKFQDGFTDLLGRSSQLAPADMEAFADFILQVTYPPNPIRSLDSSLTPDQQAGRDTFFNSNLDGTAICNGCHVLDPDSNPGTDKPGFFGTNGNMTFDFQPQLIKTPHLRNMYQKVGMFGMAAPMFGILPGDNDHKGDQVRGFGFLHDGSFDTLFRFFRGMGFSPFTGFTNQFGTFPDNPDGLPDSSAGDLVRRQLEAFVLAFDSNVAPIVGQQVTLRSGNQAVAGPRVDLLIARAEAGECDLVAKSHLGSRELGFLYTGGGHFAVDRMAIPPVSDALLRQAAVTTGRALTYTCAPPGSGYRVGVDRDEDGFLDGDERAAGSDPADGSDTP